MTATKTELLERIRVLWEAAPIEVCVERSNDSDSEGASRLDVYACVSELVSPHDHLADLAPWAFNQAVDGIAKAGRTPKTMHALIARVTLDLFDEMMRSNLEHAAWVEEKLVWRNMPARPHDVH